MLHSRFAKGFAKGSAKGFANGLTLLATLHLMGGHWLALQLVAWMGMLASYTSDGGFSIGVSKTFDGQHPCSLCQAVSSGQEKEQQQKPADLSVKIHAVLPRANDDPAPSAAPVCYLSLTQHRVICPLAPPTPPPPQLA